jgi:hypothetical protein
MIDPNIYEKRSITRKKMSAIVKLMQERSVFLMRTLPQLPFNKGRHLRDGKGRDFTIQVWGK